MKILAIETSCDETACAVVQNGTKIISNVVASSAQMHRKYGGIVPEIASRRQLEYILPVLEEVERLFDAIAVTVGPGLIGSLLVGVETAKTIAFVTGKPIIPVNHVLAHMFANFINNKNIEFPSISLVASGGHTELYFMESEKKLKWLGGTLDDAAGECFDKTARLIGLGTGGGMAIERIARKGNIKLPRPLMDTSLNFSFSGLKTAVMREWKKENEPSLAPAFAYEIQEAIADILVKKTVRAAQAYGAKSILLSGGVAANQRLLQKFSILNSPFSIHAPPPALCTDNAVFIASYAFFRGKPTDWHKITAIPDLSVENPRFNVV